MMIKCIIHWCILLLPIVCAIKESLYNAPPTITAPQGLHIPQNLVRMGNQSEKNNYLICTARNADDVLWTHSFDPDGMKVAMPSGMQQLDLKQDEDTLDLSRTITDQDGDRSKLYEFNGYYKCTATNRHGYSVESPPIRIIIADMQHGNGLKDPPLQKDEGVQDHPYKLKCVSDEIIYRPSDIYDWSQVAFFWGIRDSKGYRPIPEDSRIKINPKTGDLHFSYLTVGDGLGVGSEDPEYQCNAVIGDVRSLMLVGRHQLRVLSNNGVPPTVKMVYPSSDEERKVTCIESRQCMLTCIYGGRDWNVNEDPPNPKWTQPGGTQNTVVEIDKDITALITPHADSQGDWTCGEPHWATANISVTVLMYPYIMEHDMRNQFVTVGTDVEFVCDANHATKIKFYVNGQHVTNENPPYVNHPPGSNLLRIPNAQREHSSSVTCSAFNNAGIAYKAAELNVYTAPNITLIPENGIYLKSAGEGNATDITNLFFECNAYLDSKVLDAGIHWRTNHSEVIGQRLRKGTHKIGVTVTTPFYIDQKISSRLKFNLGIDNQHTLVGAVWWCVVEMNFAGHEDDLEAPSPSIPFSAAKGTTGNVVTAGGFQEWWLVGVIIAVCFLALIIILIICCVRQQKGEEYYVDAKERLAGHNPEEEMGLYGFSDYKRPATGGYIPMNTSDQDPIKGSRTSLDRSDKPLDSDSEGMDEYGDIDPGRFNEDGSFIGLYGKASSPMDV